MFRPQLVRIRVGWLSRPCTCAAGLFIAMEFCAFAAIGFSLAVMLSSKGGRKIVEEDLVQSLPKALAPLVAFDSLVLTIALPLLKQQWSTLLSSERWSRIFHIWSFVGRLGCTLSVSFLGAQLWSLLAFGIALCGQFLLHFKAHTSRNRQSFLRTAIFEVGVFILALQILMRANDVIHWHWALILWPLWVLIGIACVVGLIGYLVSGASNSRLFWTFWGGIAFLVAWGLLELGRFLDGANLATSSFLLPLLLALSLIVVFAAVAGTAYVTVHLDDGGGGVFGWQRFVDSAPGPTLPAEGNVVLLEALSSTLFRAAPCQNGGEADLSDQNPSLSCPARSASQDEENPQTPNCDRSAPLLNTCDVAQADSPAVVDVNTQYSAHSESTDSTTECFVCCDRQADAVIMNCGHGGFCHVCATFVFRRTGECCICRSAAAGVVQLETGHVMEGELLKARTIARR